MRFQKLKDEILGKKYSLSIAYLSEKKSREINKKYRKADKPTNVLSFSLRRNSGEIVLCPAIIKKEAKSLKKNHREWLHFLVIHGMLHLKGMKHSSTIEREKMERAENFYLNKYDQKYFHRNRRGLLHDQSRSGRIREGRKKS